MDVALSLQFIEFEVNCFKLPALNWFRFLSYLFLIYEGDPISTQPHCPFQHGRTSVFDEPRPGAQKTATTKDIVKKNPRSCIVRPPIENARET